MYRTLAGSYRRENLERVNVFDEKNHAFTICACVWYVKDECGG